MSQAVIDFIKLKRPKVVDLEHHKIELTNEFRKVYSKLTELIQRAEVYSYWRSPKDKKRGKPWGHERIYFWKNPDDELVGLKVIKGTDTTGFSERLKAASPSHKLLLNEFGSIDGNFDYIDDLSYFDRHGFGLPAIDGIFCSLEIDRSVETYFLRYQEAVTPSAPAVSEVVCFGNEPNGDFWVYEKQSEIVYTVTAFGPCSVTGLVPIEERSRIYKFPDDKTFVEFVEDFAEHNLKRLQPVES